MLLNVCEINENKKHINYCTEVSHCIKMYILWIYFQNFEKSVNYLLAVSQADFTLYPFGNEPSDLVRSYAGVSLCCIYLLGTLIFALVAKLLCNKHITPPSA